MFTHIGYLKFSLGRFLSMIAMLITGVLVTEVGYCQDQEDLSLYDQLEWTVASNNNNTDATHGIATSPGLDAIYTTGKILGTTGTILGYSVLFNVGTDPSISLNSWDNEYPLVLYGNKDGFLAKFDMNGNLLWSLNFGGSLDDEGIDVCVNSAGQVFVTGYFSQSAVFSSLDNSNEITLLEAGGGTTRNIFIACYNPDGTLDWAETDGGESDDIGMAIVATETGVVASGVFKNVNAEFTEGINTNNSHKGSYVVKYDFAGNVEWFHALISDEFNFTNNISIEKARYKLTNWGNLVYSIGFLAGATNVVYQWNPDDGLEVSSVSLGSANNQDIRIICIAEDGTLQWSQLVSQIDGDSYGFGLTADCHGLYFAGTITSSINTISSLNSFSAISNGAFNSFFVSSFNPVSGAEQFVKLFPDVGVAGQNYPTAMVTDDLGTVYLGINYFNYILFDPALDISEEFIDGTQNAAIIKFDYLLNYQSFYHLSGTAIENCEDLEIPGPELLIASGSTNSTTMSSLSSNLNGNINSWISSYALIPEFTAPCCNIPSVAGSITVDDTTLCPGDLATASRTQSFGVEQWMIKYEASEWQNFPGPDTAEISWTMTSDTELKLLVFMPGCDSTYSNIINVDMLEIPQFPESIDLSSNNCLGVMTDIVSELNNGECFFFSQNPLPGTPLGVGIQNLVIQEAEMGLEFNIEINVLDNTEPTIFISDVVYFFASDFFCGKIISREEIMPTVQDCSSYNIEIFDQNGQLFLDGETRSVVEGDQFNIVVTDEFQNQNSKLISISIVDNTGPTILSEVIGDTLDVMRNEDCYYMVENMKSSFFIIDNCDQGISYLDMIQAPMPGSMFSDNFTLFFTVYDETGNQGQRQIYVRLNDWSGPQLECPPLVDLQVTSGCSVFAGNLLNSVGIYDCSEIISFEQSVPIDYSMSPGENILVLVSALDIHENESTCEIQVHAADNIPPLVAWPQDQNIVLENECNIPVPDYSSLVVVYDDCDFEVVQNPEPGTLLLFGENITNVTITDNSGNTTESSIIINLIDDEAPVVNCPINNIVNTEIGMCGAIVSFDLEPSDNCAVTDIVWLQGQPSGSFFELGSTFQLCKVYDGFGNYTTCQFEIQVVDLLPPLIECGSPIQTCSPNVSYQLPLVSDNCSFDLIEAETNLASGSMFPPGSTSLQFTAIDNAGNSSQCTLEVQVYVLPDASWSSLPATMCETEQPIYLDNLYSGTEEHLWLGDVTESQYLDPSVISDGDAEITLLVFNPGCSSESTQNVQVLESPNINIFGDSITCGNTAVCEVVSNSENVYWHSTTELSYNELSDTEAEVTTFEFGIQEIVAFANNGGCSSVDTLLINFFEPPLSPDAGSDQIIQNSDTGILSGNYNGPGITEWISLGAYTVIDSVFQEITSVRNLSTGSNEFVISANNGICPVKSDTVILFVQAFLIPNGFSPNEDGTNDSFFITGLQNNEHCTLLIFNRNGSEVFYAMDYKNDWYGTSTSGEPLADDTYFYDLSINDRKYKGFVVIKR